MIKWNIVKFRVSIERGEWIASNLPAALLADRGELMGKEAQRLADRINIRLENTPRIELI